MKQQQYADITLERFLAGELPAEELHSIALQESTDADLHRRLEALRRSNEEILSAYTPEFIRARIEAALPVKKPKKRTWIHFALVPVGAAAAAVCVMLFIPVSTQQVNTVITPVVDSAAQDTTRFKGDDTRLFIYKKTENGPQQVVSGSVSHEGDILQIAYVSAKPYGVIFSIDGRGTVTLHYPSPESNSTKLCAGTTYLPSAYQLDDAPEFERFFFIASDSPIDAGRILSRAHKAAVLRTTIRSAAVAPEGFSETSIIVEKEKLQ
jgi:hypothetical protein